MPINLTLSKDRTYASYRMLCLSEYASAVVERVKGGSTDRQQALIIHPSQPTWAWLMQRKLTVTNTCGGDR
jgi:hypothetical protein